MMQNIHALPALPPVPLRSVHARLEALIGQLVAIGEEIDALATPGHATIEDGLAYLGRSVFWFRDFSETMRRGETGR